MLGEHEMTIEKMAREAMIEKVSIILHLSTARRELILTPGSASTVPVCIHYAVFQFLLPDPY